MSNLGRIILNSLAILVAMTAVACGAAAPAMTPSPTPTAAPSGRIDVGGYKLAYQCFGQSDKAPTTTPRTSQDVARDLHVLLGKIPLPGPYILVAHSFGGYHARVFAHLYPHDVAGMILVDTTDPGQREAFATAYPTYTPTESSVLTNGRAAMDAPITPDQAEGLDFEASSGQVRQAGSLGDIPLIVISQSPNPDHFAFPGSSLEDQERLSATWQRLQAGMASLSSNGVLITAKFADHNIPQEEPQIIIDAITRMVQEITSLSKALETATLQTSRRLGGRWSGVL